MSVGPCSSELRGTSTNWSRVDAVRFQQRQNSSRGFVQPGVSTSHTTNEISGTSQQDEGQQGKPSPPKLRQSLQSPWKLQMSVNTNLHTALVTELLRCIPTCSNFSVAFFTISLQTQTEKSQDGKMNYQLVTRSAQCVVHCSKTIGWTLEFLHLKYFTERWIQAKFKCHWNPSKVSS